MVTTQVRAGDMIMYVDRHDGHRRKPVYTCIEDIALYHKMQHYVPKAPEDFFMMLEFRNFEQDLGGSWDILPNNYDCYFVCHAGENEWKPLK